MHEVTRIIEQCFYIHYLNCKLMNIFKIHLISTSSNQELVNKVLNMGIGTTSEDNSGENYGKKKEKFNEMKNFYEANVLRKPTIRQRISSIFKNRNGGKRRTQKRKKNKRKAKQVKKSRRRGRSHK